MFLSNGSRSAVVIDQDHPLFSTVPCPSRKHTHTLLSGLLWAPASYLPCFALEDNRLCLCPVMCDDCYGPSRLLPVHVQSCEAAGEETAKKRESSRMKHSWRGLYLSALTDDRHEFLLWICAYTCSWGGRGRTPCYCCLVLVWEPCYKAHLSRILVRFQLISSIVQTSQDKLFP